MQTSSHLASFDTFKFANIDILVPGLVYLEDSAKFLSIFCWASFHITTLQARVSDMLRSD